MYVILSNICRVLQIRGEVRVGGESSSAELNELGELKLEINGKIISLQSFNHELRHIESFAIWMIMIDPVLAGWLYKERFVSRYKYWTNNSENAPTSSNQWESIFSTVFESCRSLQMKVPPSPNECFKSPQRRSFVFFSSILLLFLLRLPQFPSNCVL